SQYLSAVVRRVRGVIAAGRRRQERRRAAGRPRDRAALTAECGTSAPPCEGLCTRRIFLGKPIEREVAGEASNTAGASLSRELTAFLVEFSVSLHKHAIYPSGHPSLEPAAARVTEVAARLLQSRSTLAFGVARHQLIIDGVATDPNQPVLRRLAETLHRHQLGAMSIMPGV